MNSLFQKDCEERWIWAHLLRPVATATAVGIAELADEVPFALAPRPAVVTVGAWGADLGKQANGL